MFAYCLNNPVNGCDPCGFCYHNWDFWNDCAGCGGKSIEDKWYDFITFCREVYSSSLDYVTNTDPQIAVDGGLIAFYKGALVINLPFECTAFSYGAIFLGSQYSSNDYGKAMLNHEYGHFLQLQEYGLFSYTSTVAIPSVICNILDRADLLSWTYYSSPWEYEADKFGGVTRSNYSPWASGISSCYSYFSFTIKVFSELFLCP